MVEPSKFTKSLTFKIHLASCLSSHDSSRTETEIEQTLLKDKKFQNPDLSKFIQHLAYAVMNHQIVQLKMKRTWLKDQNFQNLEIQIYM